jgi:hypothetical protein
MKEVQLCSNRPGSLLKRTGTSCNVGGHARWNSEAGHVTGRSVKIHARDADYKGHTHRCGPDDPQYGIKSDKTGHIALHRGAVLHRID